jgi:hypothetical protein
VEKNSEELNLKSGKPKGKRNGERRGMAVTLYLADCWPAYARVCKELGQSGSSRLSNLMKEDFVQLTGGDTAGSQANLQKISDLEAQVSGIIIKIKRLKTILLISKAFHPLENLVESFGLLQDLSNTKPVMRKLINYEVKPNDPFGQDDKELLLEIMSLAAQKMKLQAELKSLRLINTDDDVSISQLSTAPLPSKPEPVSETTAQLPSEPETQSGVAQIETEVEENKEIMEGNRRMKRELERVAEALKSETDKDDEELDEND